MAVSLEAGRILELSSITSIAKTLGAPKVGELNFSLAKKYLSSVTVVSDEEAVDELLFLLDRSKVLTEPATSCTLAAAERLMMMLLFGVTASSLVNDRPLSSSIPIARK